MAPGQREAAGQWQLRCLLWGAAALQAARVSLVQLALRVLQVSQEWLALLAYLALPALLAPLALPALLVPPALLACQVLLALLVFLALLVLPALLACLAWLA